MYCKPTVVLALTIALFGHLVAAGKLRAGALKRSFGLAPRMAEGLSLSFIVQNLPYCDCLRLQESSSPSV